LCIDYYYVRDAYLPVLDFIAEINELRAETSCWYKPINVEALPPPPPLLNVVCLFAGFDIFVI
jgi:hypothetical protein